MVSCKAGQGCGEMCVTGELMHVHADEQAIGVRSLPGACTQTPPPRPLSHRIQ